MAMYPAPAKMRTVSTAEQNATNALNLKKKMKDREEIKF